MPPQLPTALPTLTTLVLSSLHSQPPAPVTQLVLTLPLALPPTSCGTWSKFSSQFSPFNPGRPPTLRSSLLPPVFSSPTLITLTPFPLPSEHPTLPPGRTLTSPSPPEPSLTQLVLVFPLPYRSDFPRVFIPVCPLFPLPSALCPLPLPNWSLQTSRGCLPASPRPNPPPSPYSTGFKTPTPRPPQKDLVEFFLSPSTPEQLVLWTWSKIGKKNQTLRLPSTPPTPYPPIIPFSYSRKESPKMGVCEKPDIYGLHSSDRNN